MPLNKNTEKSLIPDRHNTPGISNSASLLFKGKKIIYVHHETITVHFKNFLTRKETSGYHAFSIIYEFREEKSRFLTY